MRRAEEQDKTPLLFYAASYFARHLGRKEGWVTSSHTTAHRIPVFCYLPIYLCTGIDTMFTLPGRLLMLATITAQAGILLHAYFSSRPSA